MLNTWYYQNNPLTEPPESAIGFVYIIHNQTLNKYYIGKKLFWSTKTIQKKLKKKKIKIQSNWKSYTGSNQSLNLDIQNQHQIKKNIIHICYSKSQCSYLEAQEQFIHNAIINNNYYNDWISVKITRNHLKKLYNNNLTL